MQKIIFRREYDVLEGNTTGTMKKIYERKRKDTAPLISYFTENQKNRFINRLFDREAGQFNLFMSALNLTSTWPAACALIGAELNKRNIDILDQDARELTDGVYHAFFPEDV